MILQVVKFTCRGMGKSWDFERRKMVMKIGDLLGFAGIQWDLMGFDLMGKINYNMGFTKNYPLVNQFHVLLVKIGLGR